jgi:oligoendopeptidase F
MTDTSADVCDATGVVWDLTGLMPGGPEAATAAGREAISLAEAFAAAHRGRLAGYQAGELRAALEQLERLHEILGAAHAYASLRFDVDTESPEHGALLSEIEAVAARIQTLTTFFELEWIAIDDVRAGDLLSQPALEPFAHLFQILRLSKPHRLSEPEERILTEKAVTGSEAWRRLLEEQLSTLELRLDGETIGLPQALARMSSDDRDVRRRSADAITAALAPGLRTRAQIFNVLLADHAIDDRLRHYPHWLAGLNMDNEAADESVRALVDAVVARYDIPQRWSQIKARALGLDRLTDYDRFAPVAGPPSRISWSRARELVVASYSSFSAELGEQADRFFRERWIDAEMRAGKRPGAYCASTVPDANPYVLINFAGRMDDVLTLAHEIGHGLHFLLAAPRGMLQLQTPLTVAETASVFGETLMFAHLLPLAEDPLSRFGLLAQQLDEAIGTVFRQVAIHRFEDAVHRERRERGELSGERIGEHWMAANEEMFGDTVELTDGYGSWWSYVSHVFSAPGYVYAYAYGQMLALSIYARYLEQGEPFVPRYLKLLRAGGSRSPEQLARLVGVELGAPGFWQTGLKLIDQRLAEAEAIALEIAS